MPKMKTKSGAKKRFRVRGSGSVKRSQAFKRHILTKKTTKNKRHLRGIRRRPQHQCGLGEGHAAVRLREPSHAKSQAWGDRQARGTRRS